MTEFPWAAVGLNLLVSIVAVAALMAVFMGVSIRAKNHSRIDIFWGPAFVLVAVVSYLLSAGSVGDSTRRLVVLEEPDASRSEGLRDAAFRRDRRTGQRKGAVIEMVGINGRAI